MIKIQQFMMEDITKGKDQYVADSGQETILDIYRKSAKIPKLVVGLAAPGTGKTTTIVRLITKILSNPIESPIKNCLILTFTRRTRQDILNKFTKKGMIDKYPQLKRIIRNFHSLAFTTLLWKNVLSQRKCTDKINQIAVKAGLDIELKDKWTVLELIKKIRLSLAHGTSRAQIREYEQRQPICAAIMTQYLNWLDENYRDYKSISFDYALTKFLSCIQNGRNPIKMDLSTIDLLIVDQFQDSNPAQMKIVEAILQRNSCMRLLLLGDIDQTIYTWRGTDLFYLDDFIQKYKAKDEYQSVLLQNTHRLGNKVLKLSQALINYKQNYREFREKYYGKIMPISLNTKHDYQTEVILFQSEFSQVNWVIKKIKSLVTHNKDIRYKDITILLRSFKNTSFFKKFKFLNEKLEKNQQGSIPITVKSDEKNDALQQYLSWFAFFYMKKYFKNINIKDIIKSMCKTIHIKSNNSFVKMIQSYKVHGYRYDRSRQNSKQAELIDIFTKLFRSIQKIILQEEKCIIFSQRFTQVANILKESGLYPELTEPQIQQFLEIVKTIEGEMLKSRLQKDPIYSIFQQLILKKLYRTKQSKKIIKQVKRQTKHQQQYYSEQQKTPQFTSILDLVKKKTNKWKMIESVFDSSDQQEPQQIATCSKQQQRVEQTAIQHHQLADKVNIQTIYKAKGLQFKVVFICAMNFDFQHKQFQQTPQPKIGANDADLHRINNNINRKNMIKNQEQLRVIYTALTRTSRYSFVTASQRDYYKPQQCVRHPHFIFLQKNTQSRRIEFSDFQDGEFKKTYNEWNQENRNKYQKKWKDNNKNKMQ